VFTRPMLEGTIGGSELRIHSRHPMVIMAVRKSRVRSSPHSDRPGKRWVARVQTDSTHPPKGLFTKDASAIACSLASKKVSPKGPGAGMRMVTYFINRAGKGLSASRRRELEKAKKLLSMRTAKGER